jgi:hypothetical protein
MPDDYAPKKGKFWAIRKSEAEQRTTATNGASLKASVHQHYQQQHHQ